MVSATKHHDADINNVMFSVEKQFTHGIGSNPERKIIQQIKSI